MEIFHGGKEISAIDGSNPAQGLSLNIYMP
jgi:hypothetical protein